MFGSRLARFALAGLLAVSALSVAYAQDASEAELRARYNALFQQTVREPGNLDVAFQFAETATRLGEFEEAIGTFERMLLFNPDLPRVRLELGILYFRLGSYEQARVYLETIGNRTDLPREVRERVDEFLAEARRRVRPHQFDVLLQTGVRYQTNANAGPSSEVVRVFGQDATLGESFRRRGDWNAFIQGSVRHVFDLGRQSGDVIETNVAFYQAWQFRESRVDVGLIEVSSGPRLQIDSERLPGWTIRPYILGNFVGLGRDPYLATGGGGVAIGVPVARTASAEIGVEHRQRHYLNGPSFPTVNQQSGGVTAVYGGVNARFTPDLQGYARISIANNDARENFFSSLGYMADLGVVWDFDAPFIQLRRKITATANVGITHTQYRAANPNFDPTRRRRDREWRLGFGLEVPITEGVGFFGLFQYQTVDSNIPNFRNDNIAVSFGPTLRF
jgi:hypothetical protein